MKIRSYFIQVCTTVLLVVGCIWVYDSYFNSTTYIIEDNNSLARQVSERQHYIDRINSILSSTSPSNFIRAAEKSRESVVYIVADIKLDQAKYRKSYTREKGSGIIISEDGYIITNHHVIDNADFIGITLEDKREYKAEVVGKDPTSDLALLKIEAQQLPFLIFGNSDSLQVGEWIMTIGNPFGLQSTVSAGIVSAKARNIDVLDKNALESFIQTDAVINPGSSGGALVNTNGLLMGISTAIVSSSGGYEGLSFAIPSNLAHKVIVDLKEFGSVQRGKLGITIIDVNSDEAIKSGLPSVSGVQITSINLNSAAALSGFKKGDIITSINKTSIASSSEFYEQINRFRPGDFLNIEYYRKGKLKSTSVILRNYLNTTDYLRVRSDKILRDIGIEIRDLNSIEKARIERNGIMIISVSKGSTIHSTNMEAGYIVTHFNGLEINTVNEFVSLVKNSVGQVKLNGFYERYPGEFPYEFQLTDEK